MQFLCTLAILDALLNNLVEYYINYYNAKDSKSYFHLSMLSIVAWGNLRHLLAIKTKAPCLLTEVNASKETLKGDWNKKQIDDLDSAPADMEVWKNYPFLNLVQILLLWCIDMQIKVDWRNERIIGGFDCRNRWCKASSCILSISVCMHSCNKEGLMGESNK